MPGDDREMHLTADLPGELLGKLEELFAARGRHGLEGSRRSRTCILPPVHDAREASRRVNGAAPVRASRSAPRCGPSGGGHAGREHPFLVRVSRRGSLRGTALGARVRPRAVPPSKRGHHFSRPGHPAPGAGTGAQTPGPRLPSDGGAWPGIKRGYPCRWPRPVRAAWVPLKHQQRRDMMARTLLAFAVSCAFVLGCGVTGQWRGGYRRPWCRWLVGAR